MPPNTGPIYRVGSQFTEQLNYSNPLMRPVETIWHRDERYFIISSHYPLVWKERLPVAVKEYLFRYGSPSQPEEPVEGQYPVYSLIPGSYHYQQVVEEVDVFVPRDYTANKFRSQSAILTSNYPIIDTRCYYVRPVL